MKNTHKPRTWAEAADTRVWDLLTFGLILSLSALAYLWFVPR